MDAKYYFNIPLRPSQLDRKKVFLPIANLLSQSMRNLPAQSSMQVHLFGNGTVSSSLASARATYAV